MVGICSITIGTARVEFQADHLSGGNKFAITLRSRADVDLAMDLARPYLATRRERGT